MQSVSFDTSTRLLPRNGSRASNSRTLNQKKCRYRKIHYGESEVKSF
jgi:hypothetical protein